MRQSKALTKLRAGQTVRICALGHFIPAYIRHAAHYGFDCIWLDLEHRAMSDREVQALLAFFHQFDVDCMVRAPTLENTRLYRYLEDGAAGLMIPHVSTADKARSLVGAVRFPPLGNRGLDGAGLDSDFILAGGPDYPAEANRQTFLVVQIESPEAVENAHDIAAVDGVDALFIGPGDLSLRLKHRDAGLTLEQAVDRVADAAGRHGKAWGMPAATVEAMQDLRSKGAQLIAHGGDFLAMKTMLEAAARDFDQLETP